MMDVDMKYLGIMYLWKMSNLSKLDLNLKDNYISSVGFL